MEVVVCNRWKWMCFSKQISIIVVNRRYVESHLVRVGKCVCVATTASQALFLHLFFPNKKDWILLLLRVRLAMHYLPIPLRVHRGNQRREAQL